MEVLLRLVGCVNGPDGFGVTPLQYGMFSLAKDRHNKACQKIADLVGKPLYVRGTRANGLN